MPYSRAAENGEEPFDDQELPDSALEHSRTAEPDVYLDVPDLKVEEIGLKAEDVRAKVSVQAEVLDMLRLNVGADVSIGKAELDLSGVQAQVTLKVRLAEIAAIVDRVLTTLDRNPRLAEELTRGLGKMPQEAAEVADRAVDEVERPAVEAEREVRSELDDVGGTADNRATERRRVHRAPEERPADAAAGAEGAEGTDEEAAPKQPVRPVEPAQERRGAGRRRPSGVRHAGEEPRRGRPYPPRRRS
ncbi:hypothetical protein [Saccharopolyspora gloriosae]|uniref:hypothetical protein n=1 Tax=Saccharopolyspora gloriosae TaxID=455344 RepID=UPI001FB5DDF1|nr:hypothetical protein [Saccharopolyspora gloriosae]